MEKETKKSSLDDPPCSRYSLIVFNADRVSVYRSKSDDIHQLAREMAKAIKDNPGSYARLITCF